MAAPYPDGSGGALTIAAPRPLVRVVIPPALDPPFDDERPGLDTAAGTAAPTAGGAAPAATTTVAAPGRSTGRIGSTHVARPPDLAWWAPSDAPARPAAPRP